jgi:MFS family permease
VLRLYRAQIGEHGVNAGASNVTVILIIGLGPLMSSLDSTMVTIALPTITRSFHLDTGTASWLVIAYFLVLSSVLLAFGKLRDIIGFKKVFMSGLAAFVSASAPLFWPGQCFQTMHLPCLRTVSISLEQR